MLCQLEIPHEVVARGGRDGVVRRAERGARAADRRSSPTCSSSTGSSTRSSRAARSSPSPTARRAPRCSRTAARSRARSRRAVTPSTAPRAGDAFTACLTVSLLEGRPRDEALRRACAAGALAASRPGAQPSLPTAAEVDAILARRAVTPTPIILDCDPGHDDAIALLLALASPEVELVGVTTVAGNQTLEKTTTNALRVLELAGRGDVPVAAGAGRPLVRERDVAAHVHGESGMDGPELRRPAGRARRRARGRADGARDPRAATAALTLVPTGPLTNVALLLALHPDARPERIVLMGGAVGEGNRTPAAEFNIWADPEAAHRVFTSGIDVTMVGLDVTHQALITRRRRRRAARRRPRRARSSPSSSASTRASTGSCIPSSAARRCTTRSPSRT